MRKLVETTESKIRELLKDTRRYDDLINRDEYFTLTRSVSQFRDKTAFKALINIILNDPLILKEVLENSYHHHNGFHKIVLSKGALFKLRLHVFMNMPEIIAPMENIHNHRWNFASQIIKGKLKMEVFSKGINDENLFFDYNYFPDNGENKYQVDLIGLTSLQLTEKRVFESGESYYMDCEEMHRIINCPDEQVVTVVMTGIPQNTQCKLYSLNTFIEEQKKIIRYSRNELIRILETI